MKAMIFIFVRELIKRILREETEKKKKDLSPTIKELLDVVVKDYKGTVCSIDVIAPWKRLSDNPNNEEYEIRVNLVGGIGSKNWPQTQFVHRQREKIVDDVWQTVYNYLGVTSSIFTRNVKSCDEVMDKHKEEETEGVGVYAAPAFEMKPDHVHFKHEYNESELTERCWKGYTQKGMKTMFGKRYPNCVKIKKKRVNESNVIDYLKKFVGYKATDQKYQFQRL